VSKESIGKKLENFFLKLEKCLYLLISFGILFVTAIIILKSFKYIYLLFLGHSFYEGLVKILDSFLVAMMFLEVFYTLHMVFGEEHTLCPEPFIIVIIIALVRRFLIIGFEATHGGGFDPVKFKYYLIEIVILGLLIFVFVLSVFILRKQKRSREEDGQNSGS